MDKDTPHFNIANPSTIPCASCRFKGFGILSRNCLKYKIKPSEVYYQSAPCKKYEKEEL